MNTLKQLQENMKKEYIKWYEEYDGIPMQDTIANWWLKQTTLAFEAGKAEAIAMVLKEIEYLNHYCRSKFSQDCSRGETEEEKSTEMVSKEHLINMLDTLKTKLQAKE